MSNPVFDSSPIFRDPAKQRPGQDRSVRGGVQDTVPGRTPGGAPAGTLAWGTQGAQAADAASLQDLYESPSATARETRRMTYDDVIVRTGGLLALLVVTGALAWATVDTMPMLWIAGAVVGLVLGLVNAFKKTPSPALITLYAAAQGLFLGGISAMYEASFDGLVLQAVLGTVSVFAVSLFLFASGRVRVTPKFTRVLMLGMVGYLVFSLLNVVLMLFGVGDGGYGPLRSGWLGVVVGLVAVALAAASLVMDFDAIQRGVRQGVPVKFAWSAAFGLLVTLIWLYLELLRLLAILRGDN